MSRSEKTETLPTLKSVKLENLKPYARNSRTHSPLQIEQIIASIKHFGFTNPLLIDPKNQIIAGHGRLEAARKIGMGALPCIVLKGLSEAQKRALVIADNKIASNAGWDEQLLAEELKQLQADDFDLGVVGFDDDELKGYLDDEPEDGLTDEDDVPEPPKKPKTKTGDIWLLGDHRLMCGDSTGVLFAEALMGNDRADMLLTDPPYNVAYEGKTKEAMTIENDSMSNDNFREFLKQAFNCADKFMKKGGVFYIWHADSEGYNFRGACADIEWQVRQCLIWVKQTMVMGRQDYHWKHEPCLYGWKAGASHLWASDRKQTTLLEFDRPSRNEEHPTMKPVALFEYQMLNNTKKGGIVLDLFGGSGTTIIAAEKNGRKARVMELDPKYCDVIVKRWEDFTGKKATLENGKHTGTKKGRAA